jgi:hypothetical protein
MDGSKKRHTSYFLNCSGVSACAIYILLSRVANAHSVSIHSGLAGRLIERMIFRLFDTRRTSQDGGVVRILFR